MTLTRRQHHHQRELVGPNTVKKQGLQLVANWGSEEAELPVDVQLAPTLLAGAESQAVQTASLSEELSLSPQETKIYAVLKTDEACT